MPVKCGKGHYHESVQEVRECYNAPAAPLEYRRNKYQSSCVKCGNLVLAEQGRVDRNPARDKWEVTHLQGQCPEHAQPRASDDGWKTYGSMGGSYTGDQSTTMENRFNEIPRGHYATKSSGKNDYDFWRVDRPEQGPYAGRTFVKRILGGKPDLNVSRGQKFAALEAILREGIEEAGMRYANEIGRCRICNMTLTDEESRKHGMGPTCREKQ